MRNNCSVTNVYKKNNINSNIVTQLLYGDSFKILKKKGNWIKIKIKNDNYPGFIKYKKFPNEEKASHKVSAAAAKLYSKPMENFKMRKKIFFSSKIRVTKKKGQFYKFDKFWIKGKNIKKIDYCERNFFFNLKNFLSTKYKWGGKTIAGIDCSGLVQILLNYNKKFCPRDTKDQIKYFKRNIKMNKIKKNDLIFWKGHVAIAISKNKLIHAYGPLKKVVCMPIQHTVNKIYKTAGLKVLTIKRI